VIGVRAGVCINQIQELVVNNVAKRGQKAETELRKKVFSAYAENWRECDAAYEMAEDSNLERIYSLCVVQQDINSMLAKTDIIILTANKYERNILHKNIYCATKKKIKRFDITLNTPCERYNMTSAYWFQWNSKACLHIHANTTGAYTIAGSADIVRWIRYNSYLFPRLVVSYGICFGTDENACKIGDVYISRKVYPYFIGAKIKGKVLNVVDDNVFEIDGNLINNLQELRNNNVFSGLGFGVESGNYLTGEAVVSSLEARMAFNGITTQSTPVGDMEGYGLFKECAHQDFRIPCLIVKSICDWGAEKNFSSEDEAVREELVALLNCHAGDSGLGGRNPEELLDTLKDKLQAYSANHAFQVLDILVKKCSIGSSLYTDIREMLDRYKGVGILCRSIIEHARKKAEELSMAEKPLNCFVHRTLDILRKEGVIRSGYNCIEKEDCIAFRCQEDISIQLIRRQRRHARESD